MVEQRRRVEYLIPRAQFFLIRGAEQRRSEYFARKESPFETDEDEYGLVFNEVTIDSEDLRVMRDSINQMQQQLGRGLKDLKELRALVKEAVREQDYHSTGRHRAIPTAIVKD
ncbi:hypothetical protein KXD40_004965 [Peronospora effusa]|nr:hypothetical protein KXD40_004965 [Peronospora effusa]